MTKKRKMQIHIGAALVIVILVMWIAMLYVEKYRAEQRWENEFLTRYNAVLSDVILRIEQFEKANTFEDQFSCLEDILIDLTQLRAHMNMHIHLAALEDRTSEVNLSGEEEVYKLIWRIKNGGTIDSCQIEAFQADGAISEGEAAVIRVLKEGLENLQRDMTIPEDNSGNYRYVLSSVEVYERLTDILQSVRKQMTQIH